MTDPRTLERLERCAALINSPVAGEAAAAVAAYNRIAEAAGLPLWTDSRPIGPSPDAVGLQEILFDQGMWLDYDATGYWLYDVDNTLLIKGADLATVIMTATAGPVQISG